MTRPRSAHHGGERGFTLAELLVATAVFGLLMSVVLGVHLATERQQDESYRLIVANQHVRTGLDMVARDMRMAGSGFGNIPVYSSYGGYPVPARYPVLPQHATTGIDSVEIIGSQEGIASTLASAMATEADDIQVDDAAGFRVGEMVVVSDQDQAHLFQVTAINGNVLQHSYVMSPWNYGGATEWPPFGYPVGARVTQVEYVRYYVDDTEPDHPMMMRWRACDAGPMFVAKDIERLEFFYATGDTITANPADPLNIRSVTIGATMVAGSIHDPGNARRRLVTSSVPRILE